MKFSLSKSVLVASLLVTSPCWSDDAKPAGDGAAAKINYVEHIQPLLKMRCGTCHNANERKGSLSIETFAAVMEGGSSGTVVEPGDVDSSYLFSLVNHDSEPKMPPNADKLPEAEIALLRKWIELGALETSGSMANIKKKPTLAKVEVSGTRPAEVAFPGSYLGDPVINAPSVNAVTALTVSPWAPLAAISGHRQVSLYNTQTLQPLGTLAFPEGQPQVLKFTRTGDLLLVGGGRGGASGRVVVFDVRTGERKIEVGDEYDTVLAADISPDQSKIALGGPKKMLRVYSTLTGELLYEQKKHTDWITSLEFSPDGVLLASADRANGLIVWEADSGNLFYDLLGHRGPVTDVSWRLDSNVLASSSEDGTVKLWEMQNGTNFKNWNANGGGVLSVDYTREGNLVSTGRDKLAILWNGDGGKIRDLSGLADIGMHVAYDAESKRVLAGDWSGICRVWNAEDGKEVGKINTNPPKLADVLASLTSQVQAAQAQAQQATASLNALRADIEKRRVQAEELARAALAAQQQLDQSKVKVVDSKKAADSQQAALAQASQALNQAEQALAAAKAAFESAQKNQQSVQVAVNSATTALQQATQAEQAATQAAAQAKANAEKAAAEAKLSDEQTKALQAAEAAAAQAEQQAKLLKEQLEQLQAAQAQLKQTASN